MKMLSSVLGFSARAGGQFRFRLMAPNNEIIAVGEAYKSKGACMKGIESVRTNALMAQIIDRTKK